MYGLRPRASKGLIATQPNVPKVTSNPFCFQQVVLDAFSHADAGSGNMGLCLVRALITYVDRTAQWRGSDQLFVCFGAKSKGPKECMSHWIVEAISLAYEARGLTSPLGLHAHSIRAVASSQAFLKGSSMCCGRTVLP